MPAWDSAIGDIQWNRLPNTTGAQFGSGAGSIVEEGTLSKQALGTAVSPGATGSDYVLAVYSLPASSLDVAGRGVLITAQGSFGATGNNKTIKLIWGATTAVVGSAVTGGTTIATTGVVATNGGGWAIAANVFKYGVTGSNTQLGLHQQSQTGGTVSALQAPTALTAVESGAILIAVTGNAATATSDILHNFLLVQGIN